MDDPRADALAKLRASAASKDGKLVPAWSQVAAETGIPRTTLQRWWAAAEAQPMTGEVIERAATVVQAEVEESMREWLKPALRGFRRMVTRVTSDKMLAEVDRLADEDPEAAARTVAIIGKVLEAAPVIARLGDDGAPKGGTGRLDEVRRHLLGHSAGRALIGAR